MTTGSWVNGAFGLLIIANSAVGIVQELRAKHTLDSLAVVGEAHPTVRRNGKETQIERDEVVEDDVASWARASRSWSTAPWSNQPIWRSTNRC